MADTHLASQLKQIRLIQKDYNVPLIFKLNYSELRTATRKEIIVLDLQIAMGIRLLLSLDIQPVSNQFFEEL